MLDRFRVQHANSQVHYKVGTVLWHEYWCAVVNFIILYLRDGWTWMPLRSPHPSPQPFCIPGTIFMNLKLYKGFSLTEPSQLIKSVLEFHTHLPKRLELVAFQDLAVCTKLSVTSHTSWPFDLSVFPPKFWWSVSCINLIHKADWTDFIGLQGYFLLTFECWRTTWRVQKTLENLWKKGNLYNNHFVSYMPNQL